MEQEMKHLHDEIQQLHKRLTMVEEWKQDLDALVLNKLHKDIVNLTKQIDKLYERIQ